MADQLAGTVLTERYALEHRIGVGGMASVYRAIDLTTGSRVAVKVLSRDFLARNPKEAERAIRSFRREAEILRLLRSDPYVVEYVEHGETRGGDHFIAMELLEGEQLRFYIGRGKSAMGLRTFAYHAKHLIRGLMGIHAKNLVHGDLAPDNVVIVKTREGLPWPKFVDFGFGKPLDGDLDEATGVVAIMGKPQYASPEQARGEEATPGSDVYALGVVLYEMVTGHVPFEVRGIADARRIQRDAPRPISSWPEGRRIPGDLRTVILRCLEKQPADRPGLDEILECLERFSDRLDAGEEFPTDAREEVEGRDEPAPAAAPASGEGAPKAASAQSREFVAGDRVGRFEIRERIARGGMGLVYLAWDPVLLRDVAIKVATRVEDEGARRAILREARASSHLRSENIVTIYDAGTEGGLPYIAMEYVPGRTLARIIEEDGPLRGERFRSLARGILDGLVDAHECTKPVIHRDLKPANILCAGDVAKITDFGIATLTAAQHLTRAAREARTGGGGTEGSVFTMSPEQANNKPADHRSDIYSVGCVLYMMATGRAPFQGNQVAILYQHVTREPEPPSRVNPDLAPPGLDAVILKCLEKDPARRYQTARELRNALDRVFGARAGAWTRSPLVLTSVAAFAFAAAAIAFAVWAGGKTPGAGGFTLVRVAGTPVLSDPPEDGFHTTARHLDVEVSARSAGELRATVAANWMGEPAVTTVPLAVGLNRARIGLPDGAGREPARFAVTLDRPDQSGGSSRSFTVWQDLQKPQVWFFAYESRHPPGVEPLRVVRLDDLTAIVTDPGGIDEEGEKTEVPVGPNENPYGIAFTRKRKPLSPGGRWTVSVSARDRAGNRTDVSQDVEVVAPEIEIRAPGPASATSSRIVHAEVVARLRDRARPIPGLDEHDLDLGSEALAARLVVESRPTPMVPMKRVVGGYAADLELPPDMPAECDFDLEVLLEREVIASSRHRFDTVPPVITVSEGALRLASSEEPSRHPAQVESAGQDVTCLIDDGPGGAAGASVKVRIGGGDLVTAQLDAGGRFELPPLRAEETAVRIEGVDRAGNLAVLELSVVRRGLQVASLSIGGRDPDAEGRVFVTRDRVPIRLTAVGARERDLAFAVVLDAAGRPARSVQLDRLPEDPQVFQAGELAPFTDGGAVARIRLSIGASEAEARVVSREIQVVHDGRDPSISVKLDGEECRGTRTVGRFPRLEVTIADDVALQVRHTHDLVSWIRADPSAPDVSIDPGTVTTSPATSMPTEIAFTISGPPGPPTSNRFDFTIEVQDRCGRRAVRSFTIVVVPSGVAVLSIGDHAPLGEAGSSPEDPLVLGRDPLVVAVRPPSPASQPCTLVVRTYPEGGAEGLRRFVLDASEGVPRVELNIPLSSMAGGSLRERGRISFLLEEAGSARPEEILSVHYLLDREPPTWTLERNGTPLSEAERAEWIKVDALSAIRVVAVDGAGSGFDDASVDDPGKAIDGFEDRSRERIAFVLRDQDDFRGPATHAVEIRLRDAAGNTTPIRLRLAHCEDRPRVERLLTAEAREPLVQGDLVVVAEPRLWVVMGSESGGREAVRWAVKRGDREIAHGLLGANRTPDAGDGIAWPAAEGAEPYLVELSAADPSASDRTPFHRVRVLVDTAPPVIQLRAGDRLVARGKRERIGGFESLRLEITDAGADVVPDAARVSIAGPSGRAAGALAASRDGTALRIVPVQALAPGPYAIEITAADRVGNRATGAFEVELTGTVVPWTTIGPASRSATATRPTAGASLLTDEAARRRDELRTGIRFVPVWETPDRSRPPKFFMSQTEVTNEQFMRFVAALESDRIPPELRWLSNPGSTKKRVEAMSFRFDDFRRDPNLPLVGADPDVALAFAAWAGGRLPGRDEWAGAAGRYLLKDAEFPVYLDRGTPRSAEHWMRFANFQRGSKEARRVPVTELLREQASAPFGIVGLAGNVSEWVTFDPGGRRVAGTMGGSFRFSYTNEVNSPRLDRAPRMSASDAGIRVVWPKAIAP